MRGNIGDSFDGRMKGILKEVGGSFGVVLRCVEGRLGVWGIG